MMTLEHLEPAFNFAEAGSMIETDNDGVDKAKILMGVEFYEELVDQIPSAESRVLINTMAYRADPTTDVLLKAMINKAESDEDVRVSFQVDSMTHLTNPRGMPLWVPKKRIEDNRSGRLEQINNRITTLQEAGGEFHWIGTENKLKPILPLLDISHIKCTIIDDTVYLSGPNISEMNLINTTDAVVKIQDTDLADTLEELLFSGKKLEHKEPLRVEGVGSLFFDDGTSRTSVINTLASGIIADAQKEVLMLGKLQPSGGLARALRTAKNNGADVDYVTHITRKTHLQQLHDRAFGTDNLEYVRHQSPDGSELFGQIHSSLICVDEETAIVTSSVFSGVSELARMQEVALFTREAKLVARAKELFHLVCPREQVLEEVDWYQLLNPDGDMEELVRPAGTRDWLYRRLANTSVTNS